MESGTGLKMNEHNDITCNHVDTFYQNDIKWKKYQKITKSFWRLKKFYILEWEVVTLVFT